MIRKFKLRFEDNGEPVPDETVYFHADNERYEALSDEEGTVRISFPGELVERVEVGPDTVKEDWFIGRSDYLDDVLIKNPDTDEYDDKGDLTGVRGRAFWHDGTSMDQELKVEFETGAGIRYSTEMAGGFIKNDGSFFIPIADQYAHTGEWDSEIRFWFVGGDQIRFVKHRGRNFFMLIMPERFGGGKSDKGGIITGQIIDENGHPVEGAKITAEVASGGFLGILSSIPDEPKAKSGRDGKFSLVFSGGRELKKIYVNGDEPERAYRIRRKDDQEIPVPTRDMRAGTFGVYLVCPDRSFLGRFLGR